MIRIKRECPLRFVYPLLELQARAFLVGPILECVVKYEARRGDSAHPYHSSLRL